MKKLILFISIFIVISISYYYKDDYDHYTDLKISKCAYDYLPYNDELIVYNFKTYSIDNPNDSGYYKAMGREGDKQWFLIESDKILPKWKFIEEVSLITKEAYLLY